MTGSTERGHPIWGLPHIAKVLGVPEATARKLAKQPGAPIYRPAGSGSYLVFSRELRAWVRPEASLSKAATKTG